MHPHDHHYNTTSRGAGSKTDANEAGNRGHHLDQLGDSCSAREDMLFLYTEETRDWDLGPFPVSTTQVTNLGGAG